MQLPITIITGYLGSGKTTLINYILRNTDRKIAVIVNEVGELDVDGALIEKNTNEIIKFSDQCMCCAIRGDIIQTIENAINSFHPDAILIETSGLAHPVPIAMSLDESEINKKVTLDAMICVIDAENVFSVIEKDNMILEQLESSDLIILTKSDIVEDSQVEKVKKWLSRIKPETPVILSKKGEIDLNLIFGLNLYVNEDSTKRSQQDHYESDEKHTHEHFDTCSFALDGILSKKKFVKFMDSMGENVYRAKGWVSLDDGKQYEFHKVGQRWEMEQIMNDDISVMSDKNRLVFIGRDLGEITSQKEKFLL